GSSEFNRLGLTREMSVGLVAAIGVFLWVHRADLTNPALLVKAFDPTPLRTFFAMGGDTQRCVLQGIGSLIGLAEKPTGCDFDKRFPADRGGTPAGSMTQQTKGLYWWPDGSFRSAAPPRR